MISPLSSSGMFFQSSASWLKSRSCDDPVLLLPALVEQPRTGTFAQLDVHECVDVVHVHIGHLLEVGGLDIPRDVNVGHSGSFPYSRV